jgi:hypothetical protein
MTDNVYIDGISPDILSSIPAWATETTLAAILKAIQTNSKMTEAKFQRLEQALKKFTGVGNTRTSGTTTIDPKLIGNVNDELRESLKFGADEAKQHQKEKKQWVDKNKQHTVGEALFGKLSKSASAFNLGLAALDIVAAKGIAAMKENVDGFSAMYRSGVSVVENANQLSDGFMSLQHMIILSGIRLADLNGVMTKYSNTVSVYGSQKFIRASTQAQLSLKNLGYSAVEGLEFTASYLDSIKGFTSTAQLSEAQIAKSAVSFGSSMRDLSLLTGQSTTELMNKFKELAKTTNTSILSTRYGAQATESMTGFLAGLKDQNLAHQLQSLIAAPIKEVDSTVNALLSSGQGNLAQGMKEISAKITAAANNGASAEQQAEMFRQFAAGVKVSNAEKQNLQLQALGGNTQAQKSLEIITSLEQSARNIAKLTPEKQAEIKKETEAMNARNKIADNWNAIMAKFSAIFTPTTNLLNWFGDVLGVVAGGMDTIAKSLEGSVIPSIVAIGAALTGGLLSILMGVRKLKSWWGSSAKEGASKAANSVSKEPGFISKAGDAIKNGSVKLWEFMRESLVSVWSKITPVFSNIWTGLQNAFSGVGTWIANIGSKVWGLLSAPFKGVGTGIMETVANWVSKIFSVFKPFAEMIGTIGGALMRLAGVVGLLYTSFEVGQTIGTWLHGLVSDFEWFQKGMDGLFVWLDKLLQYLPGQIGDDAKYRLDLREKQAVVNETKIAEVTTKTIKETTGTIIAPKTAESASIKEPSRATVQSVSAGDPIAAEPADEMKVSPTSTDQPTKTAPIAKEPEINSILKYQTSLLEQLLDKQSDILSINRDLLKVTRNS